MSGGGCRCERGRCSGCGREGGRWDRGSGGRNGRGSGEGRCALIRIKSDGIDEDHVDAGAAIVICEEKEGDDVVLRPCLHIDILGSRWVMTEDAAGPPAHRPPDNGGCIGVGASCRIDAELTPESVGRIGRGPKHRGPIASARRHPHLGVNPRLEHAAVAPHHQRRCAPIRVFMLLEGEIARKNKCCPAVGDLSRRSAVKGVKAADLPRHHAGGIARMRLGAGNDALPHQDQGKKEQHPQKQIELSETHGSKVYSPLPPSSKMGYDWRHGNHPAGAGQQPG